jgi:AraC-like DNA-binding protein
MAHNRLCEKVIEFVLSRENGDLAAMSEAEIVGLFGIDGSRLAGTFKHRHNMTLDQFILRERLYRAFFMIEQNHRLSGSQLAQQLGFNTAETFCREFKNLFLVSPDRYIHLRRQGGDRKYLNQRIKT